MSALRAWASRPVPLFILHVVGVVFIGILDYASGPDYELRPFYLVPVMSSAWYLGRNAGLAIATLSTISLFLGNDYVGRAAIHGVFLPIWNTTSRFVLYTVVVFLTAQLRRQSDELRANRDELVRESELREGSIALFVHELRHSAASMALASSSLASSPRLADDERSFVGRLRYQARDLERVASGLLTVGRLEGGSLALDLVTVDLEKLAREAAASSVAPERVEVRRAHPRVEVRADPEHLRRAIDNYIRNALAFSSAGAHVTVDVVQSDGSGGVVVRDTGIGFTQEEAAALFRKYGRLAGSNGQSGAGLGLYLTRLIVEAHGGRVDASSGGQGKGAAFALYIPLAASGTRS